MQKCIAMRALMRKWISCAGRIIVINPLNKWKKYPDDGLARILIEV